MIRVRVTDKTIVSTVALFAYLVCSYGHLKIAYFLSLHISVVSFNNNVGTTVLSAAEYIGVCSVSSLVQNNMLIKNDLAASALFLYVFIYILITFAFILSSSANAPIILVMRNSLT